MDDSNKKNEFSPENYYNENNESSDNDKFEPPIPIKTTYYKNPADEVTTQEFASSDIPTTFDEETIKKLNDAFNTIPNRNNTVVFPGPSKEPAPLTPNNGYCNVKFLNAAINFPSFKILIGNKVYVDLLSYGNLSDYMAVPSGFRKFIIASNKVPSVMFYSQTLPLIAGNSYTMAIVNNLSGGIEIIPITNYKCSKNAYNFSFLRMANLSYNSCPLDLVAYDGTTVLSDVRFKQITPLKKVVPDRYNFYITQTYELEDPTQTNIEPANPNFSSEELSCLSRHDYSGALTSFYLDMYPNDIYTIYIIGLINAPPYLRTIIIPD